MYIDDNYIISLLHVHKCTYIVHCSISYFGHNLLKQNNHENNKLLLCYVDFGLTYFTDVLYM